jgi:hypothetical protein
VSCIGLTTTYAAATNMCASFTIFILIARDVANKVLGF